MFSLIALDMYVKHVARKLIKEIKENKSWEVTLYKGVPTINQFLETKADLLLSLRNESNHTEYDEGYNNVAHFLVNIPTGVPLTIRLFRNNALREIQKAIKEGKSELNGLFIRDNDEVIIF